MAFPLIPVALGAAGLGALYLLSNSKKAIPGASPSPSYTPVVNPSSPSAPPSPAYYYPPSPPAVAPVSPVSPVQPISPAAPGLLVMYVTTSDPAPAGDLIVRSGPNMASGQIGGAQKNEAVTVLNPNAGSSDGFQWAQISYGGGERWGAITGYVKAKYLSPSAAGSAQHVSGGQSAPSGDPNYDPGYDPNAAGGRDYYSVGGTNGMQPARGNWRGPQSGIRNY